MKLPFAGRAYNLARQYARTLGRSLVLSRCEKEQFLVRGSPTTSMSRTL